MTNVLSDLMPPQKTGKPCCVCILPQDVYDAVVEERKAGASYPMIATALKRLSGKRNDPSLAVSDESIAKHFRRGHKR